MVSRDFGISAETICSLAQYRESPLFSEQERLVLQYAGAMTHTPVEVPDSLFARLREKFNDQQLVELTVSIAWENYRARFDHGLGIESENFTEAGVCALPAGGRP